MGFNGVRRLLEPGHQVTVFDTSADAVARVEKLGARRAASPADVGDRVESVMVSLPTPDIVLRVATGEGGVAAGKKVKRVIDLSTTGAQMAQRVAGLLKAKNIALIDSPVSGGVGGAEKGTLAVMVSGPAADFEVVKAALGVIGKVFFIGEKPGS